MSSNMTVDAVGNLQSTSDGHFAGHIQVEGDADQLLGGIDAQPEPDPGYLIPSWGMEEARARIEKANRSLAKAGIEQRFEATWGEPEYRTEVDEEGREHLEEYRRLTLNHPKISYEGWRFVASLDETDAGMIVRTVPDAELDGYRPEASWCDHCQTHRQRNKTFLVQHEDGTLVQVGSDCIEKFLGVRPKGLSWIGSPRSRARPCLECENAARPDRNVARGNRFPGEGGNDARSHSLASTDHSSHRRLHSGTRSGLHHLRLDCNASCSGHKPRRVLRQVQPATHRRYGRSLRR